MIRRSAWLLGGLLLLAAGPAFGADYITNGDFSGGTTGWTHVDLTGNTTLRTDGGLFGLAAPSLQDSTDGGDQTPFSWYDEQVIGSSISNTDTVYLSLWWSRIAWVSNKGGAAANLAVLIEKPGGAVDTIWSNSGTPPQDAADSGRVANLLVSDFFTESGTYILRLYADVQTGKPGRNDPPATIQVNWDDVVLDVRQPSANNAPTVTPGATTASPASVNRIGVDSTTLSAQFSDVDDPGEGAFTVTFRVQEPDDATAVDVALNSGNGENGVTIVNDGGGNYTASVAWDPPAGAALGDYDLYFEVSDGTDNAIDDFANNPNDLTVFSQAPPSFAAGVTAVSPDSVNRAGTDSTRITSTWSDPDEQPVGSFWVTISVQEPGDVAEVLLVDSLTTGNGGLTVTDNGDGTYTAVYDWNPGSTQALGLYDLRCRVFDGTAGAEDGYADNVDELTVYEAVPNNPPVVVAGATTASPASVNRIGSEITTLSAAFTDADEPGTGVFDVTFVVRAPDNSTVDTIVSASGDGQNGVTITDGGGGNYTASVSWDPLDTDTLGAYDLYFKVSEGAASAVDDYANNPNELTVFSQAPPSFVAGVTAVSPDSVNRAGTDSTRITSTWSDPDEQPVGSFWVTISVQEPGDVVEVLLVDSLTTGNGGLTVTDNGDGTYTATYDWDPGSTQALGLYDLRCRVFDGTTGAEDGYADNVDELTVYEAVPNNPPVVAAGATTASPASVNRIGVDSTTLSAQFSDVDDPGEGAFMVTFRVQEPDDATAVDIALNSGNGENGVTIVNDGGGNYTASVAWDPPAGAALGAYDLYFEVSDGTDNAIDDFASNSNELTVFSQAPPSFAAGVTAVSPDSVNRAGTDSTRITSTWSDPDEQPVDSFWVTISVRQPGNITEVVLVDSLTTGNGGLTVTDNGDGTYTAVYDWDPGDSQALGLYDLRCRVFDGTTPAEDGYTANADELTVYESIANRAPVIVAGATSAVPDTVNRVSGTTRIQVPFHDDDDPGVMGFWVTLRVRQPDNTTQLNLVVVSQAGQNGLVIQALGNGDYLAYYDWNPPFDQALGAYDLYAMVSDEEFSVDDIYDNNPDELTVISVGAPAVSPGATSVAPDSVNRLGTASTLMRVTFQDLDEDPESVFRVTFKVREPDNSTVVVVADSLANGEGGMSVADNGDGTYTAEFAWNPDDGQTIGLYDLESEVADGDFEVTDPFAVNLDALDVYSKVANSPPVFANGATLASPSGVERIGTDSTRIALNFADADGPAAAVFVVTFKVREPDNTTELILVDHLSHGAGGLVVSDLGGGNYQAYIDWNPSDGQVLGFYDLYAQVSDGVDSLTDPYIANLDELSVMESATGSAPVISNGVTMASPDSINRTGASYTSLRVDFTDADDPGRKTFKITFKVRDESNIEYTLANALTDDSSGMAVLSTGSGQFRAEMKWHPDDVQPIGFYDLYALVEDGTGLQAVDGYSANTDELELYAEAPPGDGNLLHRGMSESACGGPTSACHNLQTHDQTTTGSAYGSWTVQPTCLTCHTPHGTSNLYLVRDSIDTPNSGKRQVILKNLGTGDPHNPDPTPGDPNSGVLGDAEDGTFTGACEVCHTQTDQHWNVGGAPDTLHFNAQNCATSSCHDHAAGFKKPASSESGGGANCSACHGAIYSPMNSSTSSYHHQLDSDAASYDVGNKTCLMCHVDHDIFRPDLNSVGARAKNLRVDTSTPVVQDDNSVLAASDYLATGSGGICLSCHVNAQTKGYTQPDGTTQTPALSKADFDAATGSHNYGVTSTFNSDNSTFTGNCVKCHNDDMTKGFQGGANKFSVHDASQRRMLAEMGLASPADPIEEEFCFQCHSETSNPNAAGGKDYYNVQGMSPSALKIEAVFGYAFAHPVTSQEGVHKPLETAGDFAAGATRHVECTDCHNVHAAVPGNPLKGAWGVVPTAWPDPDTNQVDNGNVFTAPSSYDVVDPITEEFQLCLKCHSNYTTLPGGARNIAAEINPNYTSQHGIAARGNNPFCTTATMVDTYGETKRAKCTDCHRSDVSADPRGPHGSNLDHMLVATIVSDDVNGTPLCFTCHLETVYWTDRNAGANSRYGKHPSVQGSHALAPGCFACHMWDYSSTAGLGVSTLDWPGGPTSGDSSAPEIDVYVHGQNKKWVFNERDGSPGTQDLSDAFVNGYIANIDYSANDCWAEVCQNHSPQNYTPK